MVKISATGEIIPDNEPSPPTAPSDGRGARQRTQMGGIPQGQQDPVAHMPQASIFDTLNERLLEMGIPRWNLGSYTVEPIASLGFLLALLLIGFHGLIFALLLFFVVKYSGAMGGGRGEGAPAHSGWRGGNLGGGSGDGGGGRRSGGSGWTTGSGQRLGRS